VPCPTGWYCESAEAITVGKLAVETGLFPIYEIINGEVTNVKKLKEIKPVVEYLKTQRRFAHLFKKEGGDEIIAAIQAIADANVERFGLKK